MLMGVRNVGMRKIEKSKLRWRGRARADNHFNFFFWGGGGLTLAFYG
jgi:hypothetical protein